jgi:hypothetical protein
MPVTLQYGQVTLTLRNDYGYNAKEVVYGSGTLGDFIAAVGSLPATKDFGSETLDKIGFGDIVPWMGKATNSGYECEVMYASPTPESIMVGENGPFKFISELEDSEQQRPIENHPNFKMLWAFHLATKPAGAPLADFAAKTDPVMTDAETLDNIWIRDQAERPTEASGARWPILAGQKKVKPQLQSYITDNIQLMAYRYETSDSAAAVTAAGFISGNRLKPSAFGINSLTLIDSASNWLCAGASMKQEGFLWRVNVRLLYSASAEWDSDIYTDITPA